jgi:sporulation protein YlmC with PRC-barrel domain
VQTGATLLLQLKEIDMKMKTLAAMTALALLSTAPVAFAQSMEGVDPACVMKDASGADKVDMTKCPDGKTMKMMDGAATAAPVDPAAPATDTAATPAPAAPVTTTGSTMASEVIIPSESLTGATLITGSDFTGKRVYSKAGDDIGEVNDVLLSQDGKVSAVILGVGGFLGIGEKDVLVSMRSIDMQRDGDNVKLVVDATKEILTSAPTYDRTKRTYMVN